MRFAIVDDEAVFRKQIEDEIIKLYGQLDVSCVLFSDGSELIKSVGLGNKYDAIFLDIEMKSVDGMTTAKNLRSEGISTPIIFITSHVEMAMEGYEVAAFRFLDKPIDPVRLKAVLTDLEKMIYQETAISIKKDGENVIIPISSILYVESMGNDVVFHILADGKNSEIRYREKFTNALELLNSKSSDFFKIHRCTIINLRCVKQYTTSEVTMKDSSKLAVARGVQNSFRQAMFDFVSRTGR